MIITPEFKKNCEVLVSEIQNPNLDYVKIQEALSDLCINRGSYSFLEYIIFQNYNMWYNHIPNKTKDSLTLLSNTISSHMFTNLGQLSIAHILLETLELISIIDKNRPVDGQLFYKDLFIDRTKDWRTLFLQYPEIKSSHVALLYMFNFTYKKLSSHLNALKRMVIDIMIKYQISVRKRESFQFAQNTDYDRSNVFDIIYRINQGINNTYINESTAINKLELRRCNLFTTVDIMYFRIYCNIIRYCRLISPSKLSKHPNFPGYVFRDTKFNDIYTLLTLQYIKIIQLYAKTNISLAKEMFDQLIIFHIWKDREIIKESDSEYLIGERILNYLTKYDTMNPDTTFTESGLNHKLAFLLSRMYFRDDNPIITLGYEDTYLYTFFQEKHRPENSHLRMILEKDLENIQKVISEEGEQTQMITYRGDGHQLATRVKLIRQTIEQWNLQNKRYISKSTFVPSAWKETFDWLAVFASDHQEFDFNTCVHAAPKNIMKIILNQELDVAGKNSLVSVLNSFPYIKEEEETKITPDQSMRHRANIHLSCNAFMNWLKSEYNELNDDQIKSLRNILIDTALDKPYDKELDDTQLSSKVVKLGYTLPHGLFQEILHFLNSLQEDGKCNPSPMMNREVFNYLLFANKYPKSIKPNESLLDAQLNEIVSSIKPKGVKKTMAKNLMDNLAVQAQANKNAAKTAAFMTLGKMANKTAIGMAKPIVPMFARGYIEEYEGLVSLLMVTIFDFAMQTGIGMVGMAENPKFRKVVEAMRQAAYLEFMDMATEKLQLPMMVEKFMAKIPNLGAMLKNIDEDTEILVEDATSEDKPAKSKKA